MYTTFKRPRYFDGRLLTAKDLQAEQNYHREKRRLLNRALHGWGVVEGLEVAASGDAITVSPGFALDPEGNEIVIPDPVTIRPTDRLGGFVCLRYTEVETDPTPVLAQPGELTSALEYMSIEERALVELNRMPAGNSVPIARVDCGLESAAWQVDTGFHVRRLRQHSTA